MKPALLIIAFVLLFSSPSCYSQQASPDPYKATLDHLTSLTVVNEPEWRYAQDIPHPDDPSIDDSAWPTVKAGELWSNGSRVLRRWIEIPAKINGYDVKGSRVELQLQIDSWDSLMITIFANRSLVARTDGDQQLPVTLTENAIPGEKFLLAVRIDAHNVKTRIGQSELRISPPSTRPDPSLLRDEILAARPMIDAYPNGKSERESQLEAAIGAIDFSPLERGDQAAFDQSLRLAQDKLELLDPWLKQFTVRAVGNSHIDMAWLWPWTETVEVVRNTFQSALDLMREYPDFKFTMSSARAYSWMEEKYPDIFKEVQERVKEGRWEVIGGMWVEPDLNMPGGESLVRQILVGKRYFREKFGVDVKIGWNPDSFGYNWQLPQIYKKCGMDYFVTQKLLWAQDYTKFPYRLFWWEAPDGSRLLTYFPRNYAADMEPVQLAKDLSFWAPSIYGTSTADGPEMMHLYGVGDHGGGPTRAMLDTALRFMQPKVVYPKIEFSTAAGFFRDLEPKSPSLAVPTWNDELYFEYHRGVFTTQAETKRRIRKTEEVVLNAEKFSSLATLLGRSYPSVSLDRSWKDLLFDDFHDIFPGSGIAINYVDAQRNLDDVRQVAGTALNDSLEEIAAHIDSSGAGVPVVIFNPLAWPRTELVEVSEQLPFASTNLEVLDGAGKAVPSQVIEIEKATHRARVLILAAVPPLGYATFHLRGASKPPSVDPRVSATDHSMENEFLRLILDPKSGCVTSLYDKRLHADVLAPSATDTGGPKTSICGNLLQAFRDKPKDWDAWNIDDDFENQHWDIDTADEVRLLTAGPLRAVLRVKKHFQNSTFTQDLVLDAASPRVDVNMSADWSEKHILLKVAFPVNAQSGFATFDIPYGSIQRPTTRNTPAEKAKFEVPAIHWADLSDSTLGFSLLNDCKYGYDAKGNVLRLSLLRSPEWPDPHADEGHHEFTYALYPHRGSWRDAQTVRQGYDLNYPLLPFTTTNHQGLLPSSQAFVTLDAENVVVTAVKKAENGNDLIIRFYEAFGRAADVRLQFSSAVDSASDANLLEEASRPLPFQGKTITIHTNPYEIKTIRVHLSNQFSEH